MQPRIMPMHVRAHRRLSRRGLGATGPGLEALQGYVIASDVIDKTTPSGAPYRGLALKKATGPVTLANDPVAWADAQCQAGAAIFMETSTVVGDAAVAATTSAEAASYLRTVPSSPTWQVQELSCPGAAPSPTPKPPGTSKASTIKTALVVGGFGLVCLAGIYYVMTMDKKESV